MEITLIIKIAALGILVSVISQILKQSGKDEYIFMIGLAGVVLVLFWILPYISELLTTVQELFIL